MTSHAAIALTERLDADVVRSGAASAYGAPISRTVRVLRPEGYRSLHYLEWGAENSGVPVLCVHGLTRNARDFDPLAAGLAALGRRVICPDMLGRGGSDWLTDAQGYANPLYAADFAALFARLDCPQVDWVGTSMGGIIGMILAVTPGNPVRRMIINDVGAWIPQQAMARIRDYLRVTYTFESEDHLKNHLKKIHSPFGPLTEAQWTHMARFSGRIRSEDGVLVQHFDPEIIRNIVEPPLADVDLWPFWEAMSCETLVLRGEYSDLILPETLKEMGTRGLGTKQGGALYRAVTVAEAGHAPALMDEAQIGLVGGFLRDGCEAVTQTEL